MSQVFVDILLWYLANGYYSGGVVGAYALIDGYFANGSIDSRERWIAEQWLLQRGMTRDITGGDEESVDANEMADGTAFGGSDIGGDPNSEGFGGSDIGGDVNGEGL